MPVIVIAAVLIGVLIHRQAGSPGLTREVAQDQPGSVLLVAGYGGSTRSLSVLATSLRAAGRTVQIVPPVGDNTGDLRVQARNLDSTARRAIAGGAPSVDVVGYSAGGVVARIWAAQLGGAALTRRLVTLGSPQHGTQIAGLAAGLLPGSCPTACRQLTPDSDVLSGLPETSRGPRWTSIWTAHDDLVIPPDTASLRGALNIELQQICPDDQVKHHGLPADPLTVGLVERALGNPAPTAAPPASDCRSLRQAGSSVSAVG